MLLLGIRGEVDVCIGFIEIFWLCEKYPYDQRSELEERCINDDVS